MIRFTKAYTVLHIFSIAFLFMFGCSNPQSQSEAQKLLQSEKEVLESDKSTEQKLKQFQPTQDSVYDKVSESKKVVQQDNYKPETSLDSLNRKIVLLNHQVAGLQKSLEQVKNKLQSLEQAQDKTIETKLTERKEITEEKNLQELEETNTKELVKKEKDSGEKLLERLESENNTNKSKSDDSDRTLDANDPSKNELSIMPDGTLNEGESVLKSDSINKVESENVKKSDATEIFIEEKTGTKKHNSKGVNKTTKIVTIIVAVGLVLFIFLFMVGKRGITKKKSSKKK